MNNDIPARTGEPLALQSNDPLGHAPERLADANMEALVAVAHQAGLGGIDLTALARVLDAAQRIAVAAERERCAHVCAGIAAGYAGTARRLINDVHSAHASGQRDGANQCAAEIRRA